MRIDFHVHSRYSRRPSQWVLQKIGCPESFTEPLQLYRLAKKRGMDRVTITDHNAIEGALEIAHLADTFISEEITTYFPDDGCKLHVLALDITENQHADIQRLRPNVFELVSYLHAQNILHVLAHPLYAINDRLSAAHFEQMLLLFQNLELNGARNRRENDVIAHLAGALTPGDIEHLAEKHSMTPYGERPWEKRLFAGSDDHSALNIARAFTEVRRGGNARLTLENMAAAELVTHIHPASPQTMAHNLYGIAYQFYRDRFDLGRFAGKDVLVRFLDQSLRSEEYQEPGFLTKLVLLWNRRRGRSLKAPAAGSLLTLIQAETRRLLQKDLGLASGLEGGGKTINGQDIHWFNFVRQVSDRVTLQFSDHIVDHLSGVNVFNIFHTIGAAGGLYALLAPYFVAYSLFSRDRALSREIYRRFVRTPNGCEALSADTRIAHFTDTFHEINGVAYTLQQHARIAAENCKRLTVITCNRDAKSGPGVVNFDPLTQYELPEYPEQKIACPSLLGMLQFCYEQEFTQIHTSTPGPVGLAALAIARILKLPVSGTYHTEIPQYAGILTGDAVIADITWKYTLWYYDQMDVIYTPSQSTKNQLTAKGIDAGKIRVYPRGVDTEAFHPAKRNGYFAARHNIDRGLKLLYVGRVSREKNLHLLADAFRKLSAEAAGVHLVVVGDGPYLTEMKGAMRGCPCVFTGYLKGERLATAYASSDLFVFPSTTDTFGNVVLEAQASGLPVVVTDQGGPSENVLPGETGVIVKGGDSEELLQALRSLVRHPERLRTMGKAARAYMEQRSFDAAFLQTWDMYASMEADFKPSRPWPELAANL